MDTMTPPWRDVTRACLSLALLSLLFNISLSPEMAGHWQTWSYLRKTITKVLNSGTAWAGIAVYAGWRIPNPRAGFLAGIAAAEATLLIHYLVGWVIGVYDSTIFSSNSNWFMGALVVCGPLALAGWLAHRRGTLGLMARLVVPAGAIAEPFVARRFVHPYLQIPWPERWSDTTSGIILILLGMLGAACVMRRSSPIVMRRR